MTKFGTREQVAICGVGARTPVGPTIPASAAAIWTGITGFGDHPHMIGISGEPMQVAIDPDLPEECDCIDRMVQLGVCAAREALEPVLASAHEAGPIGLLLGAPAARPGLTPSSAGSIGERVKTALAELVAIDEVQVFPVGHTAGLLGLLQAGKSIIGGHNKIFLVGGIESYMQPDTLERYDEAGRLLGSKRGPGFIPGEGAAFCLVAPKAIAEELQLPVLGRLVAVAAANDADAANPMAVRHGWGLSRAFSQAFRHLDSIGGTVDYMICDLNGESDRADKFAYTIVRHSDRFHDPMQFKTPAECVGDLGAASGPLFVALAAHAGIKRPQDGDNCLVFASSDQGQHAAALICMR